jgi:hypothetical protein
VSSEYHRQANILTLSSLDGAPTDLILVDRIEAVSAVGDTEMTISSRDGEWTLFLNPRERQRWLSWLYVLNPWLSAEKYASPIPNSL